MVKEVHRIGEGLVSSTFRQNGVSVFTYPPGDVPRESVVNAAADDEDSGGLPTLGGGFGSSIVFQSGAISRRLSDEPFSGARVVEVDVEPDDLDLAQAEAFEALASQDDGDYVVLIRERSVDG